MHGGNRQNRPQEIRHKARKPRHHQYKTRQNETNKTSTRQGEDKTSLVGIDNKTTSDDAFSSRTLWPESNIDDERQNGPRKCMIRQERPDKKTTSDTTTLTSDGNNTNKW